MSDSTSPVYGLLLFLSIIAYNSDIFESNRVTEYNEAERCVLATSVAKDVNTGKPIKQGADGKWEWYTPDRSDYWCFQGNNGKVNYRTYGESGKVVAGTNEGFSEYRDCIIADAKNWTCASPVRTMREGVSNSEHISHWKWIINWMLDTVR